MDGKVGTGWHTDWYTTPRFGNLYPGTGLLLDMGHQVTVDRVRVRLGPAPGAHFQIRVGSARDLAGLPVVARSAGPGGVIRLPLASPAHGRYVLVWFTQLPQDAAGTFQVSVFNLVVRGQGYRAAWSRPASSASTDGGGSGRRAAAAQPAAASAGS